MAGQEVLPRLPSFGSLNRCSYSVLFGIHMHARVYHKQAYVCGIRGVVRWHVQSLELTDYLSDWLRFLLNLASRLVCREDKAHKFASVYHHSHTQVLSSFIDKSLMLLQVHILLLGCSSPRILYKKCRCVHSIMS